MTHAPIRLGVVGLGAVAQSVHLPLVRRRSDLFTIAAVTDIVPGLVKCVGDAFGVSESRRFSSLQELLDGAKLDALLICTGGSHREAVVAGLGRGLAILCEKPLAFTMEEIGAIRLAIPHGPPRLMVGYMKQYDPAVSRVVELLEEIDDVRTIDISVLHPTGYSQLEFAHVLDGGPPDAVVLDRILRENAEVRRTAMGDVTDNCWKLYSGSLMSSLTHEMSILRLISSPPTSIDYVDVWRRRSAHQRHETGRDEAALGSEPPSIRVAGLLDDEARFVMDWHYLNDFPAYRETVRIIHGAGSLELAFPSPYLLHAPTVLTVRTECQGGESRTEFRSTAEAFEIELEAFAAMVIDGVPPQTGLAGAEADVRTSQAIMAAYAQRAGFDVGGEIGAL